MSTADTDSATPEPRSVRPVDSRVRNARLRARYERLLTKDEILVEAMREHWRSIALPIFYSILFAAPLVWLFAAAFDSFWGRAAFALVAMVGLAVWTCFGLWPFVQWFTRSYAVTTRRLLIRSGVFRRRLRPIDLIALPQPELETSVWDWPFGTGRIVIGSLVLERVRDAQRIGTLLSELISNQSKGLEAITIVLRSMGYRL